MWCVVGLGNPGPRYRWSRHNVGFQFVDRLCQVSGLRIDHRSRQLAWGEGSWCDERLVVARPLAYMNLSGLGVRVLMKRRGCGLGDLVVVHDDLDLGLGRLKFKQRGGDGGHKGIRSIVEVLGDQRFLRLRIGVGRPPRGVDPTDYVLQPFGGEERALIGEALDRAVDALETLVLKGLEKAMGLYHIRSET